MRKRIVAVFAASAVAMSLAGCASVYESDSVEPNEFGEVEKTNKNLSEESITLSDGRTITCILYNGIDEGGISCDWQTGSLDNLGSVE